MSHHELDPWVGAVRLRRLMVRAVTRRVLVAIVALATGLTGVSLVRAAEQARQRWGATRSVAVARHDLDPGDTVDEAAAGLEELPVAALADTALTEVPLGAVISQPVAAGEPLVETRVAPAGLTGVAALLPEGYRAIAFPVGPAGAPPVVVGDQVDLLAVSGLPTAADDIGLGATGGGSGATAGPAAPIAEAALVVDVADEAISIAVPAGEAPTVVAALTYGTVVLTLAGA